MALFVPTRNGSRCDSVSVAPVPEGGATPVSRSQGDSVAFSFNHPDIATNQEAAGSSPAGRAILFSFVPDTASEGFRPRRASNRGMAARLPVVAQTLFGSWTRATVS